MKRSLIDFIREAVADLNPLPASRLVGGCSLRPLLRRHYTTVQIHDTPSFLFTLSINRTKSIRFAVLDFRRPLVEEDHGIGGCYIQRVIERRPTWWRP